MVLHSILYQTIRKVLHPLLGSEHPQCAPTSKDDSNVASQELSLGDGSDDDSNENKAKSHENEKDKETYEEKDDVTIAAVEWTKDDQKNVMDLGSFELERSHRYHTFLQQDIIPSDPLMIKKFQWAYQVMEVHLMQNEASSATSSWMQREVLGVESSQVVPDLADDKSFINLLSIKGLLMTPQDN
ncbi:hypothetical protein OPV22_005807 [Ensete ventricosum]|uniref:Uncharacterized protein n=1 Tax=Ensete ventricosum TaxID=4639 RepID=A0AAV8RJH5_ENSVE|nr:hypothetical protein OPV22_005807 [Ensete ventricosum]